MNANDYVVLVETNLTGIGYLKNCTFFAPRDSTLINVIDLVAPTLATNLDVDVSKLRDALVVSLVGVVMHHDPNAKEGTTYCAAPSMIPQLTLNQLKLNQLDTPLNQVHLKLQYHNPRAAESVGSQGAADPRLLRSAQQGEAVEGSHGNKGKQPVRQVAAGAAADVDDESEESEEKEEVAEDRARSPNTRSQRPADHKRDQPTARAAAKNKGGENTGSEEGLRPGSKAVHEMKAKEDLKSKSDVCHNGKGDAGAEAAGRRGSKGAASADKDAGPSRHGDTTAGKRADASGSMRGDASGSKKGDAAPSKKADAAPSKRADAVPRKKSCEAPTKKSDAAPGKKSDAKPRKKGDVEVGKKVDAAGSKKGDVAASKKADAAASKKGETVGSSKAAKAGEEVGGCGGVDEMLVYCNKPPTFGKLLMTGEKLMINCQCRACRSAADPVAITPSMFLVHSECRTKKPYDSIYVYHSSELPPEPVQHQTQSPEDWLNLRQYLLDRELPFSPQPKSPSLANSERVEAKAGKKMLEEEGAAHVKAVKGKQGDAPHKQAAKGEKGQQGAGLGEGGMGRKSHEGGAEGKSGKGTRVHEEAAQRKGEKGRKAKHGDEGKRDRREERGSTANTGEGGLPHVSAPVEKHVLEDKAQGGGSKGKKGRREAGEGRDSAAEAVQGEAARRVKDFKAAKGVEDAAQGKTKNGKREKGALEEDAKQMPEAAHEKNAKTRQECESAAQDKGAKARQGREGAARGEGGNTKPLYVDLPEVKLGRAKHAEKEAGGAKCANEHEGREDAGHRKGTKRKLTEEAAAAKVPDSGGDKKQEEKNKKKPSSAAEEVHKRSKVEKTHKKNEVDEWPKKSKVEEAHTNSKVDKAHKKGKVEEGHKKRKVAEGHKESKVNEMQKKSMGVDVQRGVKVVDVVCGPRKGRLEMPDVENHKGFKIECCCPECSGKLDNPRMSLTQFVDHGGLAGRRNNLLSVSVSVNGGAGGGPRELVKLKQYMDQLKRSS